MSALIFGTDARHCQLSHGNTWLRIDNNEDINCKERDDETLLIMAIFGDYDNLGLCLFKIVRRIKQ